MPVATFGDKPEGIRVEQLDLKSGEFNGEWIKGGPLQDFSSVGILDKATATVLTIMDGFVVVDKIKIRNKLKLMHLWAIYKYKVTQTLLVMSM